jgi:hypothetical protein
MGVFTILAIRYKAIPLELLKDVEDESDNEISKKPEALDFPGTTNEKND